MRFSSLPEPPRKVHLARICSPTFHSVRSREAIITSRPLRIYTLVCWMILHGFRQLGLLFTAEILGAHVKNDVPTSACSIEDSSASQRQVLPSRHSPLHYRAHHLQMAAALPSSEHPLIKHQVLPCLRSPKQILFFANSANQRCRPSPVGSAEVLCILDAWTQTGHNSKARSEATSRGAHPVEGPVTPLPSMRRRSLKRVGKTQQGTTWQLG